MYARFFVPTCALSALISTAGCVRPYDVPEFAEVSNSETAFLVPLTGDTGKQKGFDSEKYLADRKVAVKRVRIPHEWVQTGRVPNTGEWLPTVRLIKVDRAPITREWTAEHESGTSDKNQAIWIESQDSVGFSTGITCTARIPDDGSAVKFLFNYPSGSIETVMDTEIRARVQMVMAEFANGYTLNDLLGPKKGELVAKVREDVVPFFAERGIEITTIGQFGGFHYENPKIQEAIDNVFQAQQDEEVAKAEGTAQLERNKAIKLAAEGKAEATKLEASAEAEAIKTVADAKAYEIEKAQENSATYLALKELELEKARMEKWDGKYPLYYLGGAGKTPDLLISPPDVPQTALK